MSEPNRSDRYWEQYLTSLPPGSERPARYVESFCFGFDREDASSVAALVLDGTKTATGSVLWAYEADGKRVPQVGDCWIVTDRAGDPVCIIRTTDVATIPFDEVPESYAQQGGEGDRTTATWRPIYWRYIVSECERIGREPHRKAPLVMERFAVVYGEPLQSE